LNISGNLFVMNIADNGRGMEKGKLIKGIGLKNIRSRVDLYNGAVHIVTAPGKGFIMKVSLPVH
jgi:signal transduction histidine kinase